MFEAYFGQVLNISKELHKDNAKNASIPYFSEADTYHFIKVGIENPQFLCKLPFYHIRETQNKNPTQESHQSNAIYIDPHQETLFLTLYKSLKEDIGCSEKKGLLRYDEFAQVKRERIEEVRKLVYTVRRPLKYSFFNKNGYRYLAITTAFSNYQLFIENGNLNRDGCFYKILGHGTIMFLAEHEGDKICYQFSDN